MPVAEQTRHGETVNAADLVLLDEADRASMAAALHDGLLQELLGARLLVDLVTRDPGGPETANRLAELHDALTQAIALGRGTLAALHSSGVLRQGLDAALVELAGRTGVPMAVRVDPALAHLAGAPALVTYRLAEAVRSAATVPVSVRVEIGANVLHISVTADALAAEHPALARVLQRVTALGGTSKVADDVVHAWIPLDSGDRR